MASLGSLPALQVKAPENPLDSYGKVLGLQSMIQQNQMGKMQMDQQKRSMDDQQKISDLMVKHAGNIDKVIADAPGAGVMPNTILALQQHAIEAKTKVADLVSKQGAIAAQQADLMAGAHDAVDKAPAEVKSQVYQAQLGALHRAGVDVSQMPPDYPGDDQFKMLGAVVQGHKEQVAQAIKEREVAAQELTAAARDKAAGKQPEGEMPLGQDRVGQLNQLLTQRYQVMNPGQPLFPSMQLPSNATQKDFDRIDKMMESQEKAKANQQQLAESGKFRNAMLALATKREENSETKVSRADVRDHDKTYVQPAEAVEKSYQMMDNAYNEYKQAKAQGKDLPTGAQSMLALSTHLSTTFGNVKGARITKDMIEHHLGARGIGDSALVAVQKLTNGDVLSPDQWDAFHNLIKESRNLSWGTAVKQADRKGVPVDFLPSDLSHDSFKNGAPQKAYTPPAGAKTAVGPNGHTIVVDGGKWVDAKTGQPIQ